MKIRKILIKTIKIILISSAAVVFSYIGWVFFDALLDASSRHKTSAAIVSAGAIYEAELEYKSKVSRYGKLKELSRRNLLPSELTDGIDYGFSFEIQLNKDDFIIHSIPLEKGEGIKFSMDKNKIIK